ncbi:DNA (cytosine-5-)-methyltransferase [Bacillus sp. J37]|uniref:DNA (cytosine-5-)-methyltransferase n=1 Tax=Bacillus sp. J37 TaxID=935837 RepID=UPI0004B6F8FE|nr:DNA (cytosine-5-)-methyltransferase [Bacillus sp. J37]
MRKLTLGSLFDGSGGFPLAGLLSGIEPLWASEIEPFPIRVTTKQIPQMNHLGDISQLNGADLSPVDIITFGSPCTDLSIAGKRAGLDGRQSSLFYQAIRIIKEMRYKTNGEHPKYAVWENVCGAFSSNKGQDFRSVLEEFCKIKEENTVITKPNKWENAGEIVGENFSLAWRVLDAQYWGVPQRRKRIFLVADFNGQSASQILFKRECLSGNFTKGGEARERTTSCFENGSGAASELCLNDQGGSRMDVTNGMTATLRAQSNHPPLIFENHGRDARVKGPMEVAQTVLSVYGTGGNNQPFVMDIPKTFDVRFTSEGTANVRANVYESSISRTIDTSGNVPDSNQGGIAVVAVQSGEDMKGNNLIFSASKNSHFTHAREEVANTLVATDYKDPPLINEPNCIVRRLTPTECARLQGFPDDWCSDLGTEEPTEDEILFWTEVWETHRNIMGKSKRPKTRKQIIKWLKQPHSDTAEYKMWGNGVALPCVLFVLSNIHEHYTKNAN